MKRLNVLQHNNTVVLLAAKTPSLIIYLRILKHEIHLNNRNRKYAVVRSEVFMAVTMKNVVFWDIRTQFVPHRRHITSPLQSSAG
jgi:hypothetical protein